MKKFAKKLEKLMSCGCTKKDVVLLILSGVSLVLSLADIQPFSFDIAWISIILCGIPIILEAFIGLVTEFDIKADVLVSMALIASVCIREDFAAGEVAFIMQLGALLEDLTVAKARAGIERLVHLTPRTARIVKNGTETVIPASQVKVGDIIKVLPGEAIPVDGIITCGETSINQAVMTGESLPVDKHSGDEVSSGTVNQFGAFEMKATRVGEDSSIQRMIKLVRSADAGKAKIVGIADRWTTWIVVLALLAAAVTLIVTGKIIRAVTILVVFCPCALVLATPTAIMAAIGNATKHGFLVREGDALERLASVDKITFDKTGTLTCGVPKVCAVEAFSDRFTSDKLYAYTAAAESFSEHPVGKAIYNSYKASFDGTALPCDNFEMFPGLGISADVNGRVIAAGNEKMLSSQSLSVPSDMQNLCQKYKDIGCTVVYAAADGRLEGFIALSDSLRNMSAKMIRYIKKSGVEPVLLTGDNRHAAGYIAKQLGISEVKSDCLPEDKLNAIRGYRQDGHRVCMVGDGINDAPALKCADVGIAMGKIGSDIAVDAADIAIVDDEVTELPHLIMLSKRMMKTIKVNLTFSMVLNFIAVILAIIGTLNPVVGALVHNAGSVLVIANSALLLKQKF